MHSITLPKGASTSNSGDAVDPCTALPSEPGGLGPLGVMGSELAAKRHYRPGPGLTLPASPQPPGTGLAFEWGPKVLTIHLQPNLARGPWRNLPTREGKGSSLPAPDPHRMAAVRTFSNNVRCMFMRWCISA